MLSPVHASMDRSRFASLPSTTNAVEAYNRISKSSRGPEALQVALLTLYKKDMVVVLRALAEKGCIPTSYEDQTPAARAGRVKVVNAARRRRFESRDDDAREPPDRNSDYKDGRLKWQATSEQCGKGAKRRKTHKEEEGKKEEEQTHKEEKGEEGKKEEEQTHKEEKGEEGKKEEEQTHKEEEEGEKGEEGKREEEQTHKEEEEGEKGEEGKREEDTSPPSPLDIQPSSPLIVQPSTPVARAGRVKVVNAARRRRFESRDDDGRLKRQATSEQCSKGAKRRKTHKEEEGKKEEEQTHKEEEEGEKGKEGKKEEEQTHKEEEEEGKREEDTNPPSPLDIQPSSPLVIQPSTRLVIQPSTPLNIQPPSPLVTTIDDSCPSPPPTQWWIQELGLKSSDKIILETGEWLNDLHISAANCLLQRQFPQISGLQSPVLGSKLQFSALHSEGIQILNYKKHWICISTVGCCPGHVKVYDSLYPFPSSSAILQICNLVQTRESTLVVQMMDVQTQSGGDDCGLFAIAISFALCSGKNPCEIEFRQDVMRSHLVSCFCIGKLSLPFKATKSIEGCKTWRDIVCVLFVPHARGQERHGAVCSLSGVVSPEMPEDSSCCVYENDSLAL